MQISVRNVGDVSVVEIMGNLDSQTSPDAQTQIAQLIKTGSSKILVNFEKLVYISSNGLRVLASAARQLKMSEGQLRICGPNDVIQEVFKISGLDTILNVFANETEALEGF